MSMPKTAAEAVTAALCQQANLLEAAVNEIRQLAFRADTGQAGSAAEGHGYQYLAKRALQTVTNTVANLPIGEAFQAAADADRAAENAGVGK